MLFSEAKANSVERHHLTYSFNGFVLDADRASLSRDGQEIPLRPKSFDVLVHLIKHQGVLVSKDELMGAIWPDVNVTEDSLTQCLIEVRKALADKSKTMIRTVPRRGYLFDAVVKIHQPLSDESGAELSRGLFSRRRPSAWSAAAMLVLAVAMGLTWWSTTREPSSVTQVSEATQQYVRGEFFYSRRADGDIDRAIEQFEQAVAIDPGLADAWVGLAGAIQVRAYTRGSGFESVAADYFAYLQRALESDPNHAEAHMRLARYQMYFGDPESVQFHLDKAIKHGQDSPLVMAMSAGILFYQSRFDEAIELQSQAVELDPLGAINRLVASGVWTTM